MKLIIFLILFFLNKISFTQEINNNVFISTQPYIYGCVLEIEPYLSHSKENTKNNIQQIIKNLNEQNFNTIIFALKKDNFLSLKNNYNQSNTNLLNYAIDETKKYNLKIFFLIDLLKIKNNVEKKWLCKKKSGEIYKPYYLCLAVPEVQTHLRNLLKEILYDYKIDGLILDNLKYPSQDTSYDKTSLERFYTRGNPLLLEWEDFQKEQINKFLCDLYSEIKFINKNIILAVTTENLYKDPINLKGIYYDNYQDVKQWIERNYCDFIIPKFSTKTITNLTNFTENVENNKIVLGIMDNLKPNDIKNILGIIYFSTQTLKLFSYKPNFPNFEFKNRILIGKVLDEKNQPLTDAWIFIKKNDEKATYKLSSNDGFFSFIDTSTTTINLEINYPWCEKVYISSITLKSQEIKILDPIIIKDASIEKEKLFFYIFRPKNLFNVDRDYVNLLGRTYPLNKINIFYDSKIYSPQVFKTGIFAVDKIQLKQGENNLKFIISNPLNKTSTHYLTISYVEYLQPTIAQTQQITSKKEEKFNLISPIKDTVFFTNEKIEFILKAPKNKKIFVVCFDNKEKIQLEQTEKGVYKKTYIIPPNFSSKKTKLKFEIVDKIIFFERKKFFEPNIFIEVIDSSIPIISKTKLKNTIIFIESKKVELPKNTLLEIVGQNQDKYIINLSSSIKAFISKTDIDLITYQKRKISNILNYCEIEKKQYFDQISINLNEQVVIYSEVKEENKNMWINFDIFNSNIDKNFYITKISSKFIKDIKIEQIEPDLVRLKIYPNSKQIWGYWNEFTTNTLKIYIKHPPKIYKDSSLKGLKIALEAGHGGDNNTGAIGVSGTKEKNVNLRLTQILKSLFEKEQAEVILMRQGDTNPKFEERLNKAYNSYADLIISIHANAHSTEKGFLTISGTSIYFNYNFCKNFAKSIHKQLVKVWGKNFGLFDNFDKYIILKQTKIPAVLVEQGFLTNPQDEEKLLDNDFLLEQAKAIVNGTKNFINQVLEE